jgi:histidinol-phosphate aminotransferase
MSLRPKREIARLKACPHGGIDHAELKALGLRPEEVLDFSVCTNPFMPPPKIREILGTIDLASYPDSEATEFRERLSAHLGVPAANILAGSGTTELIRLIATAYLRKGDRVLILEPTYGEYEVACRIAGARPGRYRAREEENLAPRIEEVVSTIKEVQPRAVFVCNPNNRTDVEAMLGAIGDGLLTLDEAYAGFVQARWNSNDLAAEDNIIVLRSMTKDYGLAGLRLGYALASREIIGSLRRICPPWHVNTIAQKAGSAVLENDAHLEPSLRQTQEAKDFLTDELSRLGFKVLPSDANYFLVKVGSAIKFRSALLKHGILVRDGTSFGLAGYVRIAPRTLPECRRLINAIANISLNIQ